MAYCISPEDVKKVGEIYDRLPHEGLDLSTLKFVQTVGFRIYTEACGDTFGQYGINDDKGKRFNELINNETHYALERRGYEWDPEEEIFKNLTSEEYQQTRERVLEGFVRYAIQFLKESDGSSHREDNKNIRASLENHIDA